MLLTERYKDQIAGVIGCYDRIIIQGNLPGWCYAEGMTSFLYANNIRIFDYASFAETMREEIRSNAERLAEENGIEIEFIRKIKSFRKEERIKDILQIRGKQPGLVHIFSAMERCSSYKPWHDKSSAKTFLKNDPGQCLHYYFYFIDPEYGLCYLRVPTWAPFRLQFYTNGHNLLANKLHKQGIPVTQVENTFLEIGDFEKAQALSDNIRVENLHNACDIFAQRYCPVFQRYGLSYRWTVSQVEYATDIIFHKQADLQAIYEPLIRTAVHSVKPEHIASFLGQKLDVRYQGECGNNFDTRILGTRIKHHMGAVAIKMYDKLGIVLRIETTVNDLSQFKTFREVQQRDGSKVLKMAPMKKSIYSLFPLTSILQAANRRYLEFISSLDDPSQGSKRLTKVSCTVKVSDRTYKGFNFFSPDDLTLFLVIARGEFCVTGLQNKHIRKYFPHKSASAVSRMLRRLRAHGLIKKVKGVYKYYLTTLGKAAIATGLKVRETLVIPELAGLASTSY